MSTNPSPLESHRQHPDQPRGSVSTILQACCKIVGSQRWRECSRKFTGRPLTAINRTNAGASSQGNNIKGTSLQPDYDHPADDVAQLLPASDHRIKSKSPMVENQSSDSRARIPALSTYVFSLEQSRSTDLCSHRRPMRPSLSIAFLACPLNNPISSTSPFGQQSRT